MVGQDLSEQFLHVVVGSSTDDGSNAFDFDSDLAIEIDLAFHTTKISRSTLQRKEKIRSFSALISGFSR